MDRISQLSDAVLLRILSFLPTTKDVVASMILSKRWQFLWMLVPRLVYDDSYQDVNYESFCRFVDRSLLLHEAPVLEVLHFKLRQKSSVVDIGVWARNIARRHVRELVIEIDSSSCASPAILPKSLYTVAGLLVTLRLKNSVLVDVSSPLSFPSLKNLSLESVKYPGGDEFVNRFLSKCPVLEDLYVERCPDDNVTIFTVRVPSLKRLALRNSEESESEGDDDEEASVGDDDEEASEGDDDEEASEGDDDEGGYVIDAPSLEYLEILEYSGRYCVIENNMPIIFQATIDVNYQHFVKILCSITSVEYLNLCLSTSKDVSPVGTVFHSLVDLTICTCQTEWLNLLLCMLKESPNLQSLKLEMRHEIVDPRPCWNEPSSVPVCLSSSVETLEWVGYQGTQEEKDVVAYILRSAKRLKKATISPESTRTDKKKLEMIKELSFLSRFSRTCHLIFDAVGEAN